MIYKVKQKHRDANTHKVISSLVESFATECRKLGYWVEHVKLCYDRGEDAVCTAPDEPDHGGLRQTVMKDILCDPADGAGFSISYREEVEA